MEISLPSETIFHTIESTIKAYRKFAQQRISEELENITIDQSIALIHLAEYPDLTQNELADLLFKDNASLTRMINTMVNNGFLKRSMNEEDRRRFKLEITPHGEKVVETLPKIITNNRSIALLGITDTELNQLNSLLRKIKSNCQ
ncbi:MarR family winged helix-turn-helix transcriptional regulator [Algoriphagus sp.]|uniref:MarR family winged helix-turn-helix transcriptional regulator n=1 Tax=Algoriphagus sp. TaxID=1872435 RepID=UPI0025F23684|nr:MarR family winged helix-turn-helix transcriptional regulator [Algoriphagus sp.]